METKKEENLLKSEKLTLEVVPIDNVVMGKQDEEEEKDTGKEQIEGAEKPKVDLQNEKEEISVFGILAEDLHVKGIVEKPEDFEDSEEGFEKLIKHNVNKGVDEYINSHGEEAKRFIEYMDAGGDPQTYMQMMTETDFSKIDEKDLEDNEPLQEKIIAEALRKQGTDEKEIKELVEDYKDADLLDKRAKSNLKVLQKTQKQERETLEKQQKQARLEEEQNQKDYEMSVKKKVLTENKIGDFQIEKPESQKFIDFIFKKDSKGHTMLDKKLATLPDVELKLAWLAYNDFDVSKITKAEKTKIVKSLKEKLETATTTGSGGKLDKSSGLDLNFLKNSI